MHHSLPIIGVIALTIVHALAGGPLVESMDDIDNEISVNDPTPFEGRKLFVSIETGPASAHHHVGSTTELSCEAMGHPAPHIQWLKNEMPILQDELETNVIVEENPSSMAIIYSTLFIVGMSPNKEDIYTCLATAGTKTTMASATVYNDRESIPMMSSLASLNRRLLSSPQKARITQYSKTYMGDVNSNLVIPCHATGNPMPEIQWHDRFNGRIINRENRIKALDSGELVFSSVQWEDMGNYICTAINAFGKESVTTFLYPVVTDKMKYEFNKSHRPH